jgi:long-chain fatty acid transport protein
MAGYNHGKSPVSEGHTNFNVLAPAVVEDHASLGFEYKIDNKSSVTGSYIHTFSNEVKADITQLQAFDLEMDQDAVGIAYSRKF